MKILLPALLICLGAHAQDAKRPADQGPVSPTAPQAVPMDETNPTSSDVANKHDLGILEGIMEEFDYQGQDKRDPFMPYQLNSDAAKNRPIVGPLQPLQKFDLDQLKVIGIIWNVRKPRAMLLDPQNNTFVIAKGQRLGRNNGYVAAIREGELVIIEAFDDEGRVRYQTRIMKLQRE